MKKPKTKPLKTTIGNKQNTGSRVKTNTKTLDKRFYQDKRSRYLRTKLMCHECRAIYDGKYWRPFEKLDPKLVDELKISICPACHEQFDHISDGVLHLNGTGFEAHRAEIKNLIHNTAEREEERDILNRVERIEEEGDQMTVYTTKNQLAVELGKKINNAYKGGKLEIKWSKDDKPVEVHWNFDLKKK